MLFLAFQLKINETNIFIKVAQGQSTKLNKIFSLICLGTGLPVHNKIIQVVEEVDPHYEKLLIVIHKKLLSILFLLLWWVLLFFFFCQSYCLIRAFPAYINKRKES